MLMITFHFGNLFGLACLKSQRWNVWNIILLDLHWPPLYTAVILWSVSNYNILNYSIVVYISFLTKINLCEGQDCYMYALGNEYYICSQKLEKKKRFDNFLRWTVSKFLKSTLDLAKNFSVPTSRQASLNSVFLTDLCSDMNPLLSTSY